LLMSSLVHAKCVNSLTAFSSGSSCRGNKTDHYTILLVKRGVNLPIR
jgi:hypothetical protein